MKKEEEINLVDLYFYLKKTVLFSFINLLFKTLKQRFIYIFISLLIGCGISYYLNIQKKEVIQSNIVLQTKYTNPQINLVILDTLKSIFPNKIIDLARVSNYDWFYDVKPSEDYPQTYDDWRQYQNVGTYLITYSDESIHSQILPNIKFILENQKDVKVMKKQKLSSLKTKIKLINNEIDSISKNDQIIESEEVITKAVLKEKIITLESNIKNQNNLKLSHITQPIVINKFSWSSVLISGLTLALITLFASTLIKK